DVRSLVPAGGEPSGPVTRTITPPGVSSAVGAGTLSLMEVLVFLMKLVAAGATGVSVTGSRNSTFCGLARFWPVMVMVLPPPAGPTAGEIFLMSGPNA